jgi:UDP-glucose 4-epimerase
VAFGHGAYAARVLDGRVEALDADFADRAALGRALAGADAVFHLLGRVVRGPADALPHPLAYVRDTAAMLEACSAAGVRKVVFASSGGTVYGAAAVVPTPESAPARPVSAYGAECLAIEAQLERHRRAAGLNYHVLRIANAYGPGQSPHRAQGVVAAMLFRELTGRPIEMWGPPSTTRDFVYVDDVCAALIAAAGYDGEQRVMNAGSSEGRTLDAVAADIAELLGAAAPAVVPKPARSWDVPVSILDTRLIRTTLGWRPRVAWPEGLAETARWLRSPGASYAGGSGVASAVGSRSRR